MAECVLFLLVERESDKQEKEGGDAPGLYGDVASKEWAGGRRIGTYPSCSSI